MAMSDQDVLPEILGNADQWWPAIVAMPILAVGSLLSIAVFEDAGSGSSMLVMLLSNTPTWARLLAVVLPLGFYADLAYLRTQGIEWGPRPVLGGAIGLSVTIVALVTYPGITPVAPRTGEVVFAAFAIVVCVPYLVNRDQQLGLSD